MFCPPLHKEKIIVQREPRCNAIKHLRRGERCTIYLLLCTCGVILRESNPCNSLLPRALLSKRKAQPIVKWSVRKQQCIPSPLPPSARSWPLSSSFCCSCISFHIPTSDVALAVFVCCVGCMLCVYLLNAVNKASPGDRVVWTVKDAGSDDVMRRAEALQKVRARKRGWK